MPDLDDLILTLDRLRDTLGHGPLLSRTATGIEVTQAIQYYRSREHLTDPADRAPDNAAALVAYKPAIVRAYVRPPFGASSADPVGGTLLVERQHGIFGAFSTVTTLAPWLWPTVTPLDDAYADERGTILRSLTFRIPADLFVGILRLTLRLDTGETRVARVTADLLQTLRVRIIPVSYTGPRTSMPPAGSPAPTLTLPAPTLADAQTTAALAFRMMPVQQTGSFATTPTLAWTTPLDDARSAPGACSANWDALLTSLAAMRVADGNRADVVYYGLLPATMPVNVPGCGVGGLGSARVGDGATFVHEIGHGYGFQHTPSGNAGATDPRYPTYEPYFSASIGEYGTDIQNGTVFAPASSTDYMSYGPNRWMSLYQHGRLIWHPRLAPRWLPEPNPFGDIPVVFDPKDLWWPRPPWWRTDRQWQEEYAVSPMISILGRIDEAGRVQVDSVARVSATPVTTGLQTSWTAQLVGATGEVAGRVRLTRQLEHGGECCGCAPGASEGNPDILPLRFAAMVPDTERGLTLRILDRRGAEAWVQHAPDSPVRIGGLAAEIDGEDTVRLRWETDAEAVREVWAQYSDDGGDTWQALAVGLSGGEGVAGLSGLPAGTVLVRVLAHDGFETAVSEHAEIDVPERAPFPAVLYPPDGAVVPAGITLEALGSAVDQAGVPIPDALLRWSLDGVRVARGRAAQVSVDPGEHELTLQTRTKPSAEATVRFTAQALET
ncbi:M66 family metalloprotease [Microbacterium flavum]|uniref:M66 family metalloprotease n=1 Tax=Microbacterium flavum TaxID=415216 RepID=UPI0024ADD897|nr:M66 family metalloprotease [Microbacterium flavum]